ncbi:hypothetical protein GCM10010466_49120 [Planomonospora alba]|uniref:histidine kinase n=1 Tax=Planomonospora alba TaxID=161354 RepID=A0ABP6NLU1_9ACTN
MLNASLALAGVALGLFVSGKTGGPVQWPVAVLLSLLAGIPLGFVWRHPLAVCAYQSALLIVSDRFSVFTTDTVQTLLPVVVGLLAYRGTWRAIVPGAVLAGAATAVNLADAGTALDFGFWYFPLGMSAVPVIVGRYLRSPIETVAEVERRPGLDLLLACCGVAFMVLDTWTGWHAGPWPVWGVGWFVIGCGLTAGLVRLLPGTAFALQALLVVLADQNAQFAANSLQGLFLVTLGAFAMYASWSWTFVAYLVASVVTALNIVDGTTEVTPLRVASLMAMVAAPVIVGRYLGVRRAAAELQLAMAEEARQLAAERTRADLLAERERIARDVHDIVAHHVGAMVLRAGAAQYAAPSGPVAEALADIRTTGHRVLEDLRGLLDVLRDPGQAHLPVADPEEVVRDAVERMNAAGLEVELRLGPGTELAPLVTRASAARIVQEGLTNVLKHAGPGTRAVVELKESGGALQVNVLSGPPPGPRDALPSSGRGITGMRERARALGGDLSAGPGRDGGWRLTAVLPVERAGHSCGMTPQHRLLPWRREEGELV